MKKIIFLILIYMAIGNTQTITIYNSGNSELLSNTVNSVVIDGNNNKWFATDKGVSVLLAPSQELKGLMPTIINKADGLLSDTVCCVAGGNYRTKWLGTPLGCSYYEDKWYDLTYDNYYLISNSITDIITPANDYIFIASDDAGVSRVMQDVDGISGASEISTDWHGIASNTVYSLYADSHGKRWFGTDKGVSSQYGDNSKKNWTTFNMDSGLVDSMVMAICEDSAGTMWFGTVNGLSAYDGENWTNYTTNEGLSGNIISSLATDKDGNVWVGTDNGVSCIEIDLSSKSIEKSQSSATWKEFTTNEGLSDNNLSDIALAENGDIWVATNKGATRLAIREYMVKRINNPITIDGNLDEAEWENAVLTEFLIDPEDGSAVQWGTQGKLLWDDDYLYIGFIALDPDVWGEMTDRDSHLWEEEPVEVFCDPNNDKLNYFEIEINPLGTVLDLSMDKAYSEGGTGDFSWDMNGLLSAVSINGTLNDPSDTDSCWYCEMAIPFNEIDNVMTSPMSNPPKAGDMWRLNLARYNRPRDSQGNLVGSEEISSWNLMEKHSFHVPECFGRIVFSDESVISGINMESVVNRPGEFELFDNYPNPFNPSTTIAFNLPKAGFTNLKVYNTLGQEVAILFEKELSAGYYEFQFNADSASYNLSSGMFFVVLRSNGNVDVKKIILLK